MQVFVALCVVLVTATCAQLAPGATVPPMTIARVDPAVISIGGGVPLRILGDNFPTAGDANINSLELTVGGLPCAVDILSSSSTTLVCREAPPASLAAVDAGPQVGLQSSYSAAVVLTFGSVTVRSVVEYQQTATPTLLQLDSAVAAGREFSFLTSIVASSPSAVDVGISSGTRCDFGPVYGTLNPTLPQSTTTPWRCVAGRVSGGRFNASIVATGSAGLLGAAIPSRDTVLRTFKLDDDGTPFTTHVFPRIDSVSPSAAVSNVGGTILTISGAGFPSDLSLTKVTIGGSEICPVIETSYSTVKCRLQGGTPTSTGIAGAGAIEQWFTGVSPTPNTPVTRSGFEVKRPSLVAVSRATLRDLAQYSFPDVTTPSAGVVTSFFTPAHGGTYRFYCAASDFVVFKLTIAGTATELCSSAGRTPDLELYESPNAVSAPVVMTAGTSYAVEVTYGAGSTTSWYRVGMSHTPPTITQVSNSTGNATVMHKYPQNFSTVPETVAFIGRAKSQGSAQFTVSIDNKDFNIPAVQSGALCASVDLAAIIGLDGTYDVVQAVDESKASCVWVLTILKPQGDIVTGVKGNSSLTVIVNGTTDWHYREIPARLLRRQETSTTAVVVHTMDKADASPTLSFTSSVPSVGVSIVAKTERVTGVEPASISPGDRITVTGTDLNNVGSELVQITLGDGVTAAACANIQRNNDSQIIYCTVPDAMPAGVQPVSVSLGTFGVFGGFSIAVALKVNLFRPNSGSYYGGTLLTIQTTNCPPLEAPYDITVRFGPTTCTIISRTVERIICRTNPLPEGYDFTQEIVGKVGDGEPKFSSTAILLTSRNVAANHPFREMNATNLGGASTYQFLSEAPIITSIAPTSGFGTVPTRISITGYRLAGTTIQVCGNAEGCSPCLLDLNTLGDTNVSCTMYPTQPGVYNIIAVTEGTAAGYSPQNVTYTSVFAVTSMQPKFGSSRGGGTITFIGDGFSNDLKVMVGSVECAVRAVSANRAECVLASTSATAGSQTVAVTSTSGFARATCATDECTYEFVSNTSTGTPRVSAVSPRTGSRERVTLTGLSFPSNPTVSVMVGDVPCPVVATEEPDVDPGAEVEWRIVCQMARGSGAGTKPIVVQLEPFGYVAPVRPELYQFDFALSVTSISPTVGSAAGGTLVTLVGTGFDLGLSIHIGSTQPCNLGPLYVGTWANDTHVVCETSKRPISDIVTLPVTLKYGTKEASCCAFNYNGTSTYTPTITSILRLTGDFNEQIEVRGQFAGALAGAADNAAYLARIAASTGYMLNAPLSLNASASPLVDGGSGGDSFLVRIPDIAAFQAPLLFRFPYGSPWVAREQKFIIYPETCGVWSPTSSSLTSNTSMSIMGGEIITVFGKYFVDNARSNNLRITVCGRPCDIISATRVDKTAGPSPANPYPKCDSNDAYAPDIVTCRAPRIINRLFLSEHDVAKTAAFLPVTTYVETITATNAFLTDGDTTTVSVGVRSTTAELFAAVDIGDQTNAYFFRVWFFPELGFESRLDGSTVQISIDTVTWTNVGALNNVRPGWNSIVLDAQSTYGRYIRITAPATTSEIRVAEMSVEGIIGGSGFDATGTSLDGYCLVAALIQQLGSEPVSSCLERPLLCAEVDANRMRLDYRSAVTPHINTMFPTSGPSVGGTTVVFNGVNFIDEEALAEGRLTTITVTIDGIPCNLVGGNEVNATAQTLTAKSTSFECITGPKPIGETFQEGTVVTISGRGVASMNPDQYKFIYYDKWSSPLAWRDRQLPTAGSIVTIPKGFTIDLDMSPPPLKALIIEGTLMTTTNDDIEIELVADYILVRGGWFRVGTPEVAFRGTFKITLTGDRLAPELPRFGSKVLAVDGGKLHLYGTSVQPKVTQLSTQANAGTTQIEVVDNLGTISSGTKRWNTGAKIAITTTSADFEQTEIRTILGRLGTNSLELDAPLKYTHFASTETHGTITSQVVSQVALLWRNIQIAGDESSESTGFGAHIMAHSTETLNSVYLSNVEIYNAGQRGLARRHPITFVGMTNNILNTKVNAVRFCTIRDSSNRGIVLESTNGVDINSNVIIGTRGHGIAVVGGASRNNKINDNLVAKSYPGDVDDLTVANIWITHPTNEVDGNIAAGAAHAGIWFNFLSKATTPGVANRCPDQGRLGVVRGNEAHSSGLYGIWVFPAHHARTLECGPVDTASNPIVASSIKGTRAYLNGRTGLQFGSVSSYLIDRSTSGGTQKVNIFSDNGYGGLAVDEVLYGEFTAVRVLCIAHSAVMLPNKFKATLPSVGVFGMLLPSSDNFVVDNATFVGFNDGITDSTGAAVTHYAMKTCAECNSQFSKEMGGFTYTMKQMEFLGASNRVLFAAPFSDMIIDKDGTTFTNITAIDNTVLPAFLHFADMPGCTMLPDFRNDPAYQNETVQINLDLDRNDGLRIMSCNSSYAFHRFTMFGVELINATLDGPFDETKSLYTRSVYGRQQWNMTSSTRRPWQKGFTMIIPTGKLVPPFDLNNVYDTNALNFTTGSTEAVSWSKASVAQWSGNAMKNDYFDFRIEYTTIYVRADIFQRKEERSDERISYPTLIPLSGLGTVIDTYYSERFDVNASTTTAPIAFIDTSEKLMYIRFFPFATVSPAENTMVEINALDCPTNDCIFLMPPVRPPVSYLWQDNRAWPNGELPVDNSFVVIPPGMTITLETETPMLRSLIVQGTLILHPRLEVTINTHFLIVYGGSIQAQGTDSTSTQYHNAPAHINLFHHPSVARQRIDNELTLASGTFLICGEVRVIGKSKMGWSTVTAKIEKGKKEIKTNDAMENWVTGDKVAVTSTSYARTALRANRVEEETTTIRVNTGTDDRTAEADDAFAFDHVYETVDVTESDKLVMHAKVAMLTREIDIVGRGLQGANSSGCNVMFTEYGFDGRFAASGILDGVEIKECGFPDEGLAAVEMRNVRRFPVTFSKNSVHDSFDSSFRARSTTQAVISGNVFFRSQGPTVDMTDSQLNVISGNLAFGTKFPAWMKLDANKTKPYALCTYDSRFALNTFTSNVAAGSESEGFCVQAQHCLDTEATNSGNEAHSNVIGFFGAHATPHPTTGVQPSCVTFSGFQAWHNSYAGIYSAVNADTIVDGARTHDNHIAIYLSREGDGNSTLSNSIVGGRASVFDQQDCSYFRCTSNTLMDETVDSCFERAEVFDDGTRTFNLGEIGVLLPTFLMQTKHANYSRNDDLPIVNARDFDLPSRKASLHLNSVTFANFQFGRDFGLCSGSTAISTNGMSTLPVAPTFIVNATSEETVDESKIYMHPVSDKWKDNIRMCNKVQCDALNHVLITDIDGSFMVSDAQQAQGASTTPASIISNYPSAALRGCAFERGWNVYRCDRQDYAELLVENYDTDNMTRTVELLEFQDQDFLARINQNSQPPDCNTPFCTQQRFTRPARFNTVLNTENTYLVDFGDEEPRRSVWSLNNCRTKADATEAPHSVVLRVNFPSPVMDRSVWVVGGTAPVPETENQIQFGDTPGSNYFELTDNRLYVLVPCGSEIEVHQLVTAIIGLKLDMPIEDFAQQLQPTFERRIAEFLGLATDKIRISELYPGSTIVAFKIIADDSADYDSTREAIRVNNLVMEFIKDGIDNLRAALGMPITEIEFIVWAVGTPAASVPANISIPLSNDIIATIVVLAILTFVGFIFFQLRLYKKLLKYKDFDDQLAKEADGEEFSEMNGLGFQVDVDDDGQNRPRVEIGLRSLKIRVHDDDVDEAEEEEVREQEDKPVVAGFGSAMPGWATESMQRADSEDEYD